MATNVRPIGDEQSGGGFGPFPQGYTAIYALHDPRTGQVRYVGMSEHPIRRLTEHLKPSRLAAKTHKNSWIKSLLRIGLKPTLSILEIVEMGTWQDTERRWIAAFGKSLTNGAEGGRGGGLTPEVRAKIGASHRGRVVSEETRKRIGQKSKGRKLSPEARAKIAAKMKIRVISDTHRARLSEAAATRETRLKNIRGPKPPKERRGRRPLTAVTKAKISAALRGRKLAPRSEEYRQHMKAALATRPPASEETRRRMSEAAKQRCARQAEERASGR